MYIYTYLYRSFDKSPRPCTPPPTYKSLEMRPISPRRAIMVPKALNKSKLTKLQAF